MVDLVGMIVKDLVAEIMSNMAGNTNPTASAFRGFSRKRSNIAVVNSLVEDEAKKDAATP